MKHTTNNEKGGTRLAEEEDRRIITAQVAGIVQMDPRYADPFKKDPEKTVTDILELIGKRLDEAEVKDIVTEIEKVVLPVAGLPEQEVKQVLTDITARANAGYQKVQGMSPTRSFPCLFLESIFFVINKSNREAYRNIIPPEYFKAPVLTLDKLLEDFKRMTFYTYTPKNKVVGVAALEVENDELGRIRWVYILPEHQRKDVGTSLINQIEIEAKKMKLKKLMVLYVHDKAYWAKNFYMKLGYKMIDRVILPWGENVTYEKTLT